MILLGCILPIGIDRSHAMSYSGRQDHHVAELRVRIDVTGFGVRRTA